MMSSMQQKRVWITGASSGIGEAVAEAWVRQGAQVCISARRTERLEIIARRLQEKGPGSVKVVRCDVNDAESVESAVARIQKDWGGLDIVLANAGFGVSGTVYSLSIEDYRRQMETNVYGVLRTVKAALPLISQGGSIAIVGSVAGHVSMPGGSAYSMSKFAVRALAESLWAELHPRGISVTLISPGFVESDIRKTNNQGEFIESAQDPIPAWLVVPREKAAQEVIRGIERRKKEAVITGHGKVILFMITYFKWLVDFLLLKMLKNRPEPKN
jgi:short-subunit dehydrogenase